jgi:histidinol dehydrogenase
MPSIRIIDATRTDAPATVDALRRSLMLDHLILDEPPETQTVRQIISAVRERGDTAVAEVTARVDHADIPPDAVRVPADRLRGAHAAMSDALRSAVQHATTAVRRFQESLMRCEPEPVKLDGLTLGLRVRPLRRVGVCVPGAAAPLLSSVIHCAVPAQVAGVKEIAVVAPPRHQGDVHPAILGVCAELGIDEVYRMGGAQAIAALAMGTERVARVDKIVGPGGIYVQIAKRQLYGMVDIDMFAATTEVVIVADGTANPSFVAADMLAQAEHDPGCSILITDQPALVETVQAELDRQLDTLSTAAAARRWLEKLGQIVLTRDLAEAAALAEHIAPEHLQLETANPRALAEQIPSAGAIFLGHYSPEAAGDYVAGPSHTLPTGGSARFWSGLSALSFLRNTSMIEYTRAGLERDAAAIDAMGRAERLEGHARSATIRTAVPD